MNRNTILANVLVLVVALGACESMDSPVEPEPVAVAVGGSDPSKLDLSGALTVVSSTLAGLEELDLTFASAVPVGDSVAVGDSLSVVVTDLLALGGLGLNVAPSYNTSTTSNSGTVADGEPVNVSGKTKVQTARVNYSDGSSEWDQEITTSDFRMKGKNSGGECKSQESFRFRSKFEPGAQVFQQRARSMVVCPGDGRVFFVHLNIQTVITPSGKANSHVKETCVSRREDFPCS